MHLHLYRLKHMLLVGRVGFYKVFLACLLMSILNSLLFAAIAAYGFNDIKLINNPIETEGLVSQIILACVVAPLLETLLLVKLPNILLQKAGIKNSLLLIIIPAALFGLLHHYSLLYIVVMFGNGLVMNFFYIYCLKTGYRAFYRVALLHCLYNLFAVLMP